ncbi:MAG: HupE/UreJ family protein, partial [Pseudanabaenaceae cyanobacterium]
MVLRMFLSLLFLFLCLLPAQAHHMMGGELPRTAFDGFFSGLAHPVIGLDHFATVIAVGILGALLGGGIIIPIVFLLAASLGTFLHLLQLELPFLELGISLSLLVFSSLIISKHHPQLYLIIALALVGGIWHGYAYGESSVGGETSPLVAYLLGFTFIQLAVTLTAFFLTKGCLKDSYRPIG